MAERRISVCQHICVSSKLGEGGGLIPIMACRCGAKSLSEQMLA